VPRAAELTGILATLASTLALAARVRGRLRGPLRLLIGLAGAALVGALLLGHLQSLPQLLLPVMIPLLLGWTFGRTLLPGRTPLIDLVAREVHEVPQFEPRMTRYTRRVTALWTGIFAALVLGNGFLLFNAQPGGLLALAQLAPVWPVPLATCARISAFVLNMSWRRWWRRAPPNCSAAARNCMRASASWRSWPMPTR